MARLIGIILMVLSIWIGMEVYNEGAEGAFGGIFAGWNEPLAGSDFDHARPHGSNLKRVGESVQQSYDEGMKRYENLDP